MKKLFALILGITLMFSVVGCSSGESSSSSSSANTSSDDVNLAVYQNGNALTMAITGNITTDFAELMGSGQDAELYIRFRDEDDTIASYTLNAEATCCEDRTTGEVYDIKLQYNSDEIVITDSNFNLDFNGLYKIYITLDVGEDELYRENVYMDEIEILSGTYSFEGEETTYEEDYVEDFPFADQNYMCFVYEGSTVNIVSEYIVGEVEVTSDGYIVSCDYGSYTLTEKLKYNGDEAYLDVDITQNDSTNDDLYIDASVDHETGEILIEIYENGEALNRLKFFAFETIYQDYYTYDENGDVTEIPMTISVDGTSIKINIQGKYETDWIELSDEIYNNSNLYISGYDITDLDSGEVCRFFIQDCGYVVDGTVVYDGLTYRIFNDGYAVSFGAFINSVDTNGTEITVREELLLGSFTGDDTGNTVEVTNSQFILNNETYIDIDTEILLIYSMMGSDYPVYIDGELAYSLSCYVYESENDGIMASFNGYDVINEIYLLDNFEKFYKD